MLTPQRKQRRTATTTRTTATTTLHIMIVAAAIVPQLLMRNSRTLRTQMASMTCRARRVSAQRTRQQRRTQPTTHMVTATIIIIIMVTQITKLPQHRQCNELLVITEITMGKMHGITGYRSKAAMPKMGTVRTATATIQIIITEVAMDLLAPAISQVMV